MNRIIMKDGNVTAQVATMEPKMLPHNLDAEQALLGCMLIDEKVPLTVVSEVKPDDFYSETHKNIYIFQPRLRDR